MRHIACASDHNYVPHAAAMLHSLLDNQSQPGEFSTHFLHDDSLQESDIEKLKALVTGFGAGIIFHHINESSVEKLPDMGRISRVMWYRLFLPELIPPGETDRVLYLDCDVIVRGDIGELWELALGGYHLAAVSNVFERGREARVFELGLNDPREYFNSGVLLLNLTRWHADASAEQVLEYAISRRNTLVWPDQDALNHVFRGSWFKLHPRWNCQNSFFYFRNADRIFAPREMESAKSNPVIVHYEGGVLAKPWHYLCKNPYKNDYFYHVAAAGWPTPAIAGKNAVNRFLRLFPRTWILPTLYMSRRLRNKYRRLWAGIMPK